MRVFVRTPGATTGAVCLAILLGFGLGAPAAAAAGTVAAQKAPLTQTNRRCDASVLGADRPAAFGFATVVRSGSGNLIASVALKGGPPNTTYNIRLIQILPDDGDCGSATAFEGTLTTDALGAGNANVQEPVLPGATTAWVDLNNANSFDDFFDAAPVHL